MNETVEKEFKGRGKEKPVHVCLSPHGAKNVDDLKDFRERITSQIEDSQSGKIVALIEYTDIPESEAMQVTQMVDTGTPPIDAYLKLFGVTDDQMDESKEKLEDIMGPYTYSKLKTIDNLSIQYPERVRILFEGIPDIQAGKLEFNKQRRNTAIRKSAEALLSGNLSGAIKEFQTFSFNLGQEIIERESRLTNKIKTELEKPDVEGMVIQFGSGHTEFYRQLKDEGYNISSSFSDYIQAESDDYQYTPDSDLVNQIVAGRGHNISKLDWGRALIAKIIFTKMYPENIPQEAVRRFNQAIYQMIASEADLKEVANKIKKNGLMKVIDEITSTITVN